MSKKTSLLDFAQNLQKETNKQEQKLLIPDTKMNSDGTFNNMLISKSIGSDPLKDKNDSYVEYNKNVTNLDPTYSNLTIANGQVLVRVFQKELEYNETLNMYIEEELAINVSHQSGQGFKAVKNPYSFSRKAVVISAPNNSSFKPGMIVGLTYEAIVVRGIPQGQDTPVFNIQHSFLHPECRLLEMPEKIDSEHYGYLLIPPHFIQVILNEQK